jgi:predicted nucleotidyltransferase
MIQLSDEQKAIVAGIVSKYPYAFYVFGSRATGKAKAFSDLDLATEKNLSPPEKAMILTEFEESNLPFKVDLISLDSISASFKSHIGKDLTPFEEPRLSK